MTSERIASSVASPPALRMMWASPVRRPRHVLDRQPRVHAGEDRELAAGRQRQRGVVELGGVALRSRRARARTRSVGASMAIGFLRRSERQSSAAAVRVRTG